MTAPKVEEDMSAATTIGVAVVAEIAPQAHRQKAADLISISVHAPWRC
jgi:hypothetical protein|tara:strand:+ start:349 stop:492 length:144 start_codon:yes stop_codon:yes gene_type:complete